MRTEIVFLIMRSFEKNEIPTVALPLWASDPGYQNDHLSLSWLGHFYAGPGGAKLCG